MKTTYKTTLEERILKLKQAKKDILNTFDILPGEELRKAELKTIVSLNQLTNMLIQELEELENLPNLYRFYFQYNKDSIKEIEVCTRRAKRPAATKEYRTLKDNFERGYIEAYGYELIKE